MKKFLDLLQRKDNLWDLQKNNRGKNMNYTKRR